MFLTFTSQSLTSKGYSHKKSRQIDDLAKRNCGKPGVWPLPRNPYAVQKMLLPHILLLSRPDQSNTTSSSGKSDRVGLYKVNYTTVYCTSVFDKKSTGLLNL
jgi:hypothetical protein